jgi:hypothetical protein
MTDEEAKQLAEAHWKWLESLLHKIYVDAMVHGIKHGAEDCFACELKDCEFQFEWKRKK